MNSIAHNLDNLFYAAITQKVSPAIASVIGTLDATLPRYEFVGGTLFFRSSAVCTKDTIFDLASLTKVFATTLICAEAVLLGKLSLDEKPFTQWPDVRIVDLLQHNSGLPAIHDLYRKNAPRHEVFDSANQLSLTYPTRTKTVYSDVGFIVLGSLLEKRLNERLDAVFGELSRRYYGSLSMRFIPTDTYKTAPTGFCPVRRRHLQGEVNDLTAFALEGIAPHAGLFGTLSDVEKASQYLLSAIKHPNTPMSRILCTFAKATGTRAVGFDKAVKTGSTAGFLSTHTVGHLGFTGTSFWLDPFAAQGKGAYFILLTNHLEASTRKTEIMHLRRDFHRMGNRWLNATDV